jgi:outer membrane protein TolC
MQWLVRLLFFVVFPVATATAAEPLSLDEAVSRALAAAPQIAARSADAEAMRSRATSAGRLPDPRLIVGVDNLPVEGPDAWSTGADFMTMQTLGFMQEFPTRAKRRLERERADADALIAGAERDEAGTMVAREAASAWIGSAAIEAALADLERLRPDLELGAAAARAGLASGTTSATEALAAEAVVARLANRIFEMQGEAQLLRTELERWIGDDAARPLAAIPTFERLPMPAPVLLGEMDRHAAIRPFDAKLAAARTDVDLARAARRPDWSAELTYGKRGPGFDDMASLEFTVGLPIFARNRQNPEIAARSAELRRAEADREAMVRAHTAELRQALVEWEQAGARLERYEHELLPLARERSRTALASYRAGRSDLRLVLDAFEDEAELLVEHAEVTGVRGRAWASLAYLEPQQATPIEEDAP